MRTFTRCMAVALVAFGASSAVPAQQLQRDSVPALYRVLSERPAARVLRLVGPPGSKSPMHVHPPHFAYVMHGGRVRFTSGDGQVNDVPLQTGQRFEIPRPLTHAIEVTGADTIVVLLVEYWQDSSSARSGTGLARRSTHGAPLRPTVGDTALRASAVRR